MLPSVGQYHQATNTPTRRLPAMIRILGIGIRTASLGPMAILGKGLRRLPKEVDMPYSGRSGEWP